jgi:hypothetical protein
MRMNEANVRSIHQLQIDLPEEISDDEVEFCPCKAVNNAHQNQGIRRKGGGWAAYLIPRHILGPFENGTM